MPTAGLPPATQVGANTFGALVNGQVWVPAGNNGTANLTISFDPGFINGALNVGGYRITDSDVSHRSILGFWVDHLNNYSFPHNFLVNEGDSDQGFAFTGYSCQFSTLQPPGVGSGSITITRLDTVQKIISGTFYGILTQPGCDTVHIEDGRFDMKLY